MLMMLMMLMLTPMLVLNPIAQAAATTAKSTGAQRQRQ
jgi:hypothetical protein